MLQRGVQELVDHRALAAAAHPGHTDQASQGELHVEAAEVVARATHQRELAGAVGPAFSRGGNGPAATQIGTGQRLLGRQQRLEIALSNDFAAMDPSSRANVDDVVGGANRVLVVLHHDQGVAQIPELHQGVQQPVVVALMQTDARLVEHVEHSRQTRTDLGGQTDPLGLTTREGHRWAIQAQVIQAHVQQELQAHADLPQHQIANLDLTGIEQSRALDAHQLFDPAQALADAAVGQLVDPVRAHPHSQGFRLEAQTMAAGAGHQLQIFLELLANRLATGIAQLTLEDRQDSFERPQIGLVFLVATVGLDGDRFP